MYIILIITLLATYLNRSQSQCPITCNAAATFLNCYITDTSPELEDNWIELCYDASNIIQILNIFITDYQNTTFPINSQPSLSINNIIIHFYQSESLILTSSSSSSSSSNSNISSLTLSGANSFGSGLSDFLSHFPNLISLYIMNNTLLRYIGDRSFVSLTRLQLLTVEGVGIERIGEDLFVGLSQLIRLEWTASNTSVIESSALHHLTSLQYLNLQNNSIASIEDSLFRRFLPNLQHISLASNLLTSVPYQAFEQSPLLSLLRLDYNPLNCTCDLYWAYYAMQNYNLTITLSCAKYRACNQTSLCYTTPASYTTALNTSQISTDCEDEDTYECLSPSQPCQHICTNSPTGFNCSCDEGYTSFCSNSPCCIPSRYSCPINLTDTLQDDTVLHVSPLPLAENRSLILSSAEDQITLNLSISVSSHVLVVSCQVDWQECVDTVVNMTLLESFSLVFSLPSGLSSPLHYLLLRVEETESGSVQLEERLLVVTQSSDLPTLYTRSLVSSSVVLVGVAVSSLEPSLCLEECPALSVSLFSVGLVEVDISAWEGVSVQQRASCLSRPTQHWMSYSSYLISIEWGNVSSELNGRYELRVNRSGLMGGVAEFIIDYPVADNACEGRLEMGVYWNWTTNGTAITVPCYELFGPDTNEDGVYPNQVIERSCNANLQWSGITTECSFYVSTAMILSFTGLIFPSPQLFTSLYYTTFPYVTMCINHVIDLLLGFLRVELISVQQKDNLVIFWFNASNVTFDEISNFPSTELSVELSECLTDYSLHFVSQSTACRCISSPSEYTYKVQHTLLCDRPACNCSDLSCVCERGFYGDGTNCSFDTDGDGLPDHPVTCGDSPCVDMCPYQSRCESASTVSEQCEAVCPIDTDTLFSIAWPCTAGGANREVSCPEGVGSASRYCGTEGNWTHPDTQSCESAAYTNLTQLDQLLDILTTTPPVVYGDLLNIISILEEYSSNVGSSSVEEEIDVLELVTQTISVLVSDTNIDLLVGLQRDRPVAELLLNYTNVFIKSLAMRDCTEFNIEYDRVNFRVSSVSQAAAGGNTLSAVNINIGESNFSPSIDILSGDASCASFVAIENLAALVTDTSSSLRFGSEGLADTSFEQIMISSPILSVDLYQNNQMISDKGGDPLVRLNIPIDTSDIDLEKYRIEVAIGFLGSQYGVPRWEGDGIDLVANGVAYTVSAEVTHFTSFTALIGLNSLSVTSYVIPVFTYVGCSIAILCLALSLIMYVIFGYRLLKRMYHFVHFNLALSLLLSYIVFVVGVELGYANFLQLIPCKIISGLLTYLILVTFLWMLVETVVVLIMAVWPYYRINKKYFIIFFCISWLTPLLYTLITLPFFHPYLVSPPFNSNSINNLNPVSGVCWIHTDVSTSVAVIFLAIPAIVITLAIITICITVGIYVLLRSFRIDEPELPKSAKASIRLLLIFSIIFPFVIIGWLFGLLAISLKSKVLFWLFAISASAQGMLFLLLVVLIRNSTYLSILKLMARVSKCLRISGLQRCLTQQPSRDVSGYDEPFSDEPTATHLSVPHITPSESTTSTTRAPLAPPGTELEMTILNQPIQELKDLVAYLNQRPFDRPRSRWVENEDYYDNLTTRI